MEEKKKSKKIIVISIVIAIMIISIVVAVIMLSNAEKLELYNSTLELGKENYTEEIIKSDNVYVKEGYTYSVKDNKIDINNVGTYDLTFEIKGEGKTIEETKQIQVVDTTPPTVELKQDTFYIGDNINVEEIVKIQDLSQGEIPYKEANTKLEGQFDTSKEGESKVIISVTDKNGNTGTQELKIKVENPKVNLYDYIMQRVNESTKYSNGSYDNKFVLKFSYNFGNGISADGWINFTEKTYYEYSKVSTIYGTVKTADLSYFDKKGKVNKVYVDNKLYKGDLSDYQSSVDSEMKQVNDLLENKNNKISLIGKTIEQLKKETIDIRKLK